MRFLKAISRNTIMDGFKAVDVRERLAKAVGGNGVSIFVGKSIGSWIGILLKVGVFVGGIEGATDGELVAKVATTAANFAKSTDPNPVTGSHPSNEWNPCVTYRICYHPKLYHS